MKGVLQHQAGPPCDGQVGGWSPRLRAGETPALCLQPILPKAAVFPRTRGPCKSRTWLSTAIKGMSGSHLEMGEGVL